MSFFATCVSLRRNLRAVWPPNASLYSSSTCVHLRLLASPFDQGFKRSLSPGQTELEMVASSRKLYLRRDLRWVAKRTRKPVSSQVHASHQKKKHFKVDISCISLATNTLMDVTQLALTWVGWPNGEKLASTCMQIWSRPKWAQVIASQCKCTQALAKRIRK